MQKNFLAVMLSFLKVGTIGFGGGAALIPVIEEELVAKKAWIDKEDFDSAVVVSSISPASLPVAMCSIWDSRYSLISAYSYALPGPLIYLLLMTGFSFIGEAAIKYIQYASVGIIAFVLLLLYLFIGKNYSNNTNPAMKTQFLIIAATAFLLNCGGTMKRLFAALLPFAGDKLPSPIFSINMVNLLLMAFFIIGFVGGSKSKIKLAAALLLTGLYALSIGGRGILKEWSLPLTIIMAVSVTASIIYDVARKRSRTRPKSNQSSREALNEPPKAEFKLDYKPLRNLSFFVLISIAFTAVTYFVSRDANTWDYVFKIVVSSLTSFGGGQAYIGVADAVFVETGFISREVYSSYIVAVASAMPGPILVIMAAGVGYTYGSAAYGIGFGWMFGLLGLCVSVAATAFGALLINTFFQIFENTQRLHMIKRYLMPVVCGILATVAFSLLEQAAAVIVGVGANPFLSFGIVIVLFFLMMLLHKKFRVNDLVLLFLGGAGTLLSLSLIAG